jgi:helix-turn-helix protein
VGAGNFKNTNKDDNKDDYDDLLASIGAVFATSMNGDGLTEDRDTLISVSNTKLETIIEFSTLEDNHGVVKQKPYTTERFCSTTNNLNMLALQITITRSQGNEVIELVSEWQAEKKVLVLLHSSVCSPSTSLAII